MIRIGKIVAVRGLQGSIILKHIAGKSDWLKEKDVIFIELNKQSFIPFFITEAIAADDEQYVLQLEDVDKAEDAKKFMTKAVYVKEEILVKHAKDSPLLWIGFNVVDKQLGSLGIIEDVMETGKQWLAKITYKEKEVLLPLVAQTIIEVNLKNKFLRMNLPDGLIDVYLG